MFKKKSAGQSTLEFAVIIAVVAAGLLLMHIYMKRGVMGKLRESTDEIGEQYSAGNTTSKYTIGQDTEGKTKETFGLAADGETREQGVSSYKVVTPATTTRKALGSDAEKITKTLSEESLFEE